MSYGTLDDVYLLGFAAQAFVIVPRPWDPSARKGDAIDIATGTIRMAGHGYSATDLVEALLIGAGSLPGGMPSGVLLSTIPVDFFRFRLATVGGPVLTYVSPGSGWSLQIDPERRLQRHLDDAQARINECLIAYDPPLKPDPVTGKYPSQVVGVEARIAARSAIPSMQFEIAAYRVAADRVLALEASDDRMLADWKMGKPITPEATDQNSIPDDGPLATNGVVTRNIRHDMRWVTGLI